MVDGRAEMPFWTWHSLGDGKGHGSGFKNPVLTYMINLSCTICVRLTNLLLHLTMSRASRLLLCFYCLINVHTPVIPSSGHPPLGFSFLWSVDCDSLTWRFPNFGQSKNFSFPEEDCTKVLIARNAFQVHWKFFLCDNDWKPIVCLLNSSQ